MNTRCPRPIWRWAIVLAVAIGVSPRSLAAAPPDTTATVLIRILAPATLAAPAVVRLINETPNGEPFVAEIAGPGQVAVFRQVPAGPYQLVVTLATFKDAVLDVSIAAGGTHEFVSELQPIGPGAGSTVRIGQTQPAANERRFDRAALQTFPGDDPMSSVTETTVAPVIVDRMSTGGLWIGEAALTGGQAGSWRQTSMALGALEVSDPMRTGTPLAHPSWESVESLTVATAMLPASARGPGPVLTLVPRTAGSRWRGAGEVGVMPGALQADVRGDVPAIARFADHHDGSVAAGGPAGDSHVFLSWRRSASTRLEREDPLPLDTAITSWFGSVTRPVSTQGIVRVVGTVDRATLPYPGRPRFADRDARERDTFGTAQATWDHRSGDGTAWSVSGGFTRGAFSPRLDEAAAANGAAIGVVERLRDGPVPALFDVFPGTRSSWTVGTDVAPALARLGWRHGVTAGGSVARHAAVTHPADVPGVAELLDGLPARVWNYSFAGADMRWASTELSGYLADRVVLTRRLRADAGVRVDAVRGGARGASNTMTWFRATPRLGIRWAAGRDGRFALYGGYAQYAHRAPLDYFAYGDPSAISGTVSRWDDRNGDRTFQADERGVLVAMVGPGADLAQIDPAIAAPYTYEWTGGLDVPLASWTLRFVGVIRHERHLVGLVNTGVTKDQYVARSIPDLGERYTEAEDDRPLVVYDRPPSTFGNDRYLLTNPSAPQMEYWAFDVTLDGSIKPQWRTRLDATAYHGAAVGSNVGFLPVENDQGIIGAAFVNPNAETYARGHPYFDRGYVIKWWTAYDLPRRTAVSAVARYQDGLSFSRLVVVPDLNQGPEAIQAYRRGRTRFTFAFTLDLHAEKTFNLGRTTVAGIAEVFNLLNTHNEVEEDVVTRPSFRTPTAVQPPLAGRLAIRVGF